MLEEPASDVGAQPFNLVRLCRYSCDLSPQPMIAVEGTTHLVRYLNTAFEHLVGKPREELIGYPFAEAVPEGQTNGCLALLDRVYRTKQPEILTEQEHSQASTSYWSYSVWPLFEANPWPVGVMIQITDMTETVIFRRQVVAMNEQLLISATRQHELTQAAEKADQSTEIAEKANQAKSEFLSRMSHELRTPLNAILGFGQILDAQQLTLRQKESVGYILKGGWHLLDLVNEVLDITGIEKGESRLSLEPISLADVVPTVCALVRPLAAERNIQLAIGLDENTSALAPRYVLADLQRLKQVLINLLSNAIKYNCEGGQVTVSCHSRPNGRLQIIISDTGPGIAAEDLPKLFTPFERLNAAQSGIEGTGLGLVLSRELVKAMGGSLKAESVLGQGSTFCIELPQAVASKATVPPASTCKEQN